MKKLLKVFLIACLIFTTIFTPLYSGGNRWTSKPPIGSTIDWSHPLAKGLVGCWLLNEGAGNIVNDIARSNKGTLINGVLWKPTNRGTGLSFDGTDDYVSLLDGVKNNPKIIPFTICMRVKATSSTYGIIASKGGGSSTSGWGVAFTPEANSIEVFYKEASGDTRFEKVSNATLSQNIWYSICVVMTFDTITASNNQASIYVNGILDSGTVLIPGTPPPPSSTNVDILFGCRNNITLQNFFTGFLEYEYFYNRALTPSEIQQLYQDPHCFIQPPTIWSNFSTAIAAIRRIIMVQ